MHLDSSKQFLVPVWYHTHSANTLKDFIKREPACGVTQTRYQDFMWGGANDAKVDQTTKMYFLLSDPFI